MFFVLPRSRHLLLLASVSTLLIVSLLVIVPSVMAEDSWIVQSVTCNLSSNSVTVSGIVTDDWQFLDEATFSIYVNAVFIDEYTFFPPGPGAYSYTVGGYAEGVLIEGVNVEVRGPNASLHIAQCSLSQDSANEQVFPPTSIWLAWVCEPFDGYSGDMWTTVDSDAASKPWGTKLYVAASANGPWSETVFLQPPYIISQSQMEALAAMVGAATPYDMWLRAGEVGSAANYSSMVEDRNAIMDELCGF